MIARRPWGVLSIAILATLMGSSPVWSMDLAACQAMANSATTEPGPFLSRAAKLESVSDDCRGKGTFDVALAVMYLSAGRLDDLRRSIRLGIAAGSKHQPELLQTEVEALIDAGQVSDGLKKARDIVQTYPSYSRIHYIVAGQYYKQSEWMLAYEEARKANVIEGSALSYVAMAPPLYKLQRFDECVGAMQSALLLEPSRIASKNGLTEAIYSLHKLHRDSEAAELIKRHIAANPHWADYPPMLAAARDYGLAK